MFIRKKCMVNTIFSRDASYQKLMPHSDVVSEEDCDALYPQCTS